MAARSVAIHHGSACALVLIPDPVTRRTTLKMIDGRKRSQTEQGDMEEK